MSTQARDDTDTATIERSPAEIEREIERTRDRMSSNLDELSDRLRLGNLGRRARHALVDRALDAATVALGAIARNPLPAIAVTLGVLSFVVRRQRRRG